MTSSAMRPSQLQAVIGRGAFIHVTPSEEETEGHLTASHTQMSVPQRGGPVRGRGAGLPARAGPGRVERAGDAEPRECAVCCVLPVTTSSVMTVLVRSTSDPTCLQCAVCCVLCAGRSGGAGLFRVRCGWRRPVPCAVRVARAGTSRMRRWRCERSEARRANGACGASNARQQLMAQ